MFINGKLLGEIMVSLVISRVHTHVKITSNTNKLNAAVFRVNTEHVTYCLLSQSIYVQRFVSEASVCILDGSHPHVSRNC